MPINLFNKQKPAAPGPSTGTDVLRQTVKARSSTPGGVQAIAREVDGLGVTVLERFADGGALGVETLQALTVVLYPHARFDVERDLLCAADQRPAAGYITPPSFIPETCYRHNPNSPRFNLSPPATPKARRPGWADSIF